MNAEILSVSTDSIYSHKVWNDTELKNMVNGGIPFPMLSDEDGRIGKLYDVYDTQTGSSLRGTFIIDPQGYVQAAEVLNSPVGRNIDETIRLIKAFQHYASTGEVLPSGWVQGNKTIIPAVQKSGEVWKEWSLNK